MVRNRTICPGARAAIPSQKSQLSTCKTRYMPRTLRVSSLITTDQQARNAYTIRIGEILDSRESIQVIQDSLSPVYSNSKVNRSAFYCTWVQICIVIMRWPCQQKERIVMKAIRFIPTGVHAYFDYIGGITLLAAPFIFGFFNLG